MILYIENVKVKLKHNANMLRGVGLRIFFYPYNYEELELGDMGHSILVFSNQTFYKVVHTSHFIFKILFTFFLQTHRNLKLDHIILISAVINESLNQCINEVKEQGLSFILDQNGLCQSNINILSCSYTFYILRF